MLNLTAFLLVWDKFYRVQCNTMTSEPLVDIWVRTPCIPFAAGNHPTRLLLHLWCHPTDSRFTNRAT